MPEETSAKVISEGSVILSEGERKLLFQKMFAEPESKDLGCLKAAWRAMKPLST